MTTHRTLRARSARHHRALEPRDIPWPAAATDHRGHASLEFGIVAGLISILISLATTNIGVVLEAMLLAVAIR